MKKIRFSKEILVLFFILSFFTMTQKVLLDVKDVVESGLKSLIPTYEHIEYKVYSSKYKKTIDGLDELTVIRNMDDFKNFQKTKKDLKINSKWLDNKLSHYNESFFESVEKNEVKNEKGETTTEETVVKHGLIIITLNNENGNNMNRVTSIEKKNGKINIFVQRRIPQRTSNANTWFAIVEVNDNESQVYLNMDMDY